MTEVYLFDMAGFVPPEGAEELLPVWRRERYERLRNENARRESLCAGLLYAFAMQRRGLDPAAPVTILPAGRPMLEEPGAYFSLSHSGRYVMCAVSGAPVGADVQQMRTTRLSAVRMCHPAERAWLESLPEAERESAFFRLWTRKEAWVKAVSRERTLRLREADVIHALPGLSFRDYSLPGGYAAAVCAGEQELPELLPVSAAELLDPGRI